MTAAVRGIAKAFGEEDLGALRCGGDEIVGPDDGAGAGIGGRVCELDGRAGVMRSAGRRLYGEVTEALVEKGSTRLGDVRAEGGGVIGAAAFLLWSLDRAGEWFGGHRWVARQAGEGVTVFLGTVLTHLCGGAGRGGGAGWSIVGRGR